MSGLSLGTCVSNLNFIAMTILGLLAFNAQKFRGSHDPGHTPFSKKIRRHVRTVPVNMRVKSLALTVSELLAIYAQKFRGHETLDTPHFWKFLSGHVRTVPRTRVSNLKSVSLTVSDLLAFTSKIGGHVILGTPPFQKKIKKIKGSCPDCCWEHACQI